MTSKKIDRHLFDVSDDFRGIQRLIEDGDIKEDMVADQLEAINVEFELKAAQVAYVIANISAPLEAIDKQIERLSKKKELIGIKTERLRHYLLIEMKKMGKNKIDGDAFTISLSKPRGRVVVGDADQLPDKYIKVKTDITPDKKAIKLAIDSGEIIEGARIEIGEPELLIK